MKLYRGASAIVAGAIPSHAIYFATYELVKAKLNRGSSRNPDQGVNVYTTGVAGACATVMHDLVVTPLDVIKQRLQMYNSRYSGFVHAARSIIHQEGPKAFFASYPTTVAMNVPFMAVHFITYECAKEALTDSQRNYGVKEEFLAGGIAGALGGLVSTPLDVLKTRLQTQHLATITSIAPDITVAADSSCCAVPSAAPSKTSSFSASAASSSLKPGVNIPCPISGDLPPLKPSARPSEAAAQPSAVEAPRDRTQLRQLLRQTQKSAWENAREVAKQEGFKGFFKGATARVLYFAPSAAIVWTTYETMKKILMEVSQQD